jgi:hypothetical protein
MSQRSRIGMYDGPDTEYHKRVMSLGSPDLRKMLLNAMTKEDLEERIELAEHFFAREIGMTLPDGEFGHYYGVSYERAKQNLAKYGITLQRS